jgi:cellulase
MILFLYIYLITILTFTMPAMSKITNTLAAAAALFATATAHTAVEKFVIGGVEYPGFYQGSKQDPGNKSPAWWTEQGWGYQPVYGDAINTADFICHIGASPSPYTVEAPAGSDITFTWKHEGECGGAEVGWDCSHHGYTATYLAPCNGDCSKVDPTSLEFFKIHSAGLIDYREGRFSQGSPQEQTGFWGTDAIFYENSNTQTVKIPSIRNGNYVMRTEVMSVHNNGDVSNRQFWPQCANIKVTGGDDSAPIPAGTKATELYKASDALLQFDIYWHQAGETLAAPGPAIAKSVSASLASLSKKGRRHARDIKN